MRRGEVSVNTSFFVLRERAEGVHENSDLSLPDGNTETRSTSWKLGRLTQGVLQAASKWADPCWQEDRLFTDILRNLDKSAQCVCYRWGGEWRGALYVCRWSWRNERRCSWPLSAQPVSSVELLLCLGCWVWYLTYGEGLVKGGMIHGWCRVNKFCHLIWNCCLQESKGPLYLFLS